GWGHTQPWAFTPDSRYLLGTTDGRTRMWDADTGRLAHFYSTEFEGIRGLAGFTADSRCVLLDGDTGLLCELLTGWPPVRASLRQLDGPPPRPIGGITPRVELPVCVSPDGLLIARATAEGGVQVVPLLGQHASAPAARLDGEQGKVTALAFSRDGKRLAAA